MSSSFVPYGDVQYIFIQKVLLRKELVWSRTTIFKEGTSLSSLAAMLLSHKGCVIHFWRVRGSIEIYSCWSMLCYESVANPFLLHYNWHNLKPALDFGCLDYSPCSSCWERRATFMCFCFHSCASASTIWGFLSASDTLLPSYLFSLQASLFACLGVLFMIMSLSFIIIDWMSGGLKSGGSH